MKINYTYNPGTLSPSKNNFLDKILLVEIS